MTCMKSTLLTIFYLCFTLFARDNFAINKMLGRGMNMGNMLEAPSEGEWGVTLDSAYFPLIKSKGFSSVRIPVRWSAAGRMDTAAPYTMSEKFMKRVQWAVDQALKSHLAAVINVHHYNELFQDPDGQHARFISMWRQVAPFFSNYPDSLVFEILNEPNSKLTPKKWSVFLNEALDTIRRSNPRRAVVVGTAEWGGVGGLNALKLPHNDPNLILTVHYYMPICFTHQKTSWVKGAENWEVAWEGSYFDKQSVADDFEYVSEFAKEHKLPVYVGEFGAYKAADMASRLRWTSYCSRLFEQLGFSWGYWEFCSHFGIYDPDKKVFRDSLVHALISNDTKILQSKKQPFSQGASLLKNGDFSSAKQPWTVAITEGSAKDSIIDGAIHFFIMDPGPFSHAVQLVQGDLTLQKGKSYAFGFDAWANGKRTIDAKVQESVNYMPYAAYRGVPLTSKKRHFLKVFTMPETRNDCRVCFAMGGSDTTGVIIDNVTLCPVELSK